MKVAKKGIWRDDQSVDLMGILRADKSVESLVGKTGGMMACETGVTSVALTELSTVAPTVDSSADMKAEMTASATAG